MWKMDKDALEAECKRLEEENTKLKALIENSALTERDALEEKLDKNRALLTGKEICLQHMELSLLMKEREKDRARNPLFW